MPMSVDGFKPAASAALTEQIETLAPNAAALESVGFNFQLAAYLVKCISDGEPDMSELRTHGLGLKPSVVICEAIAARHARMRAAMAALEAPTPAPRKPCPPLPCAVEPSANTATAMLVSLCEQIQNGHPGCLTELMRDGWSESCARELARHITAATLKHRTRRI